MSVIFLVRHGQASLGAADYDQLSPKGFHQSALVGAALRERGATPTSVVSGDLRRHVQTVSWAGLADAAVDPRWNEFDHKPILEAACGPIGTLGDLGAEGWLDAKRRWTSGKHDTQYPETFAGFTDRVHTALKDTAHAAGRGGCAVVVTSAGVIASIATALLGGGPELWHRLQTVAVNTGITKVIAGSRGLTLVSFNDHSHLEPNQLTYG
ncbi:histidine phosphatase family protein [Rhodococcus koreensis]|uniref:Broad specificity phosphatase PhoE n=1 Tax=Rhodococcus koreensis TaxID=99653 RepID=A0A1H4L176_9NOCA|nr:histidine phosphatase family protein [Rhodococcus koreensis]SEB64497.1 Broad specificity phosphatase PhoE [Rhodococcus koreensis]